MPPSNWVDEFPRKNPNDSHKGGSIKSSWTTLQLIVSPIGHPFRTRSARKTVIKKGEILVFFLRIDDALQLLLNEQTVHRSLIYTNNKWRENSCSNPFAMSDKQHELVQRYINTREYLTIKIYDCYLLFHRNIVQHSASRELGLGRWSRFILLSSHLPDSELPPAIVQRIFGSNPLSVIDVTSSCHVDASLYDIIIFADKSAVYTRTKLSLTNRGRTEAIRRKKLPYYVQEDLELLRCCGMSEEDIDLFVRKLADNSRCDMFASSDYDRVLQKIIDYSDISTRLR